MKPSELAAAVTEIVGKACKCETSWTQADRLLTAHECRRIGEQTYALIFREQQKAFDREIDARRRVDARILPSLR